MFAVTLFLQHFDMCLGRPHPRVLQGGQEQPGVPKKGHFVPAASSCGLLLVLQLRVSHRGQEGMDGQGRIRLETFPGSTCHVSTAMSQAMKAERWWEGGTPPAAEWVSWIKAVVQPPHQLSQTSGRSGS